jgi:16S rRNA (guanine966-N2)-methyltransferase
VRIVAGEARGRRLLGPRDRTSRPPLDRTRESIFSILQDRFAGRAVLDLFAGTGSLGLEAVSRGATSALFVEEARQALEILRRNIAALGFESRCEVVAGSALALPRLGAVKPPGFALVFLDPPFKMFLDRDQGRRVYQRLEELLSSPALEPGGMVVLRQPATSPARPPVSVLETRDYGESIVLFLEGPRT